MTKKFYVTTPIYYANWLPHIGHAYSSLLADILARSKRMLWYKVKFSTWVDENSQKAVLAAQDKWMEIMDFLDELAAKHKAVWDGLNISYTDFIRTTETRHHEFVRKILEISYNNGDIYQWEYKWLYCVGCEAFKKETDLIKNDKWELVCPDHLKKPDEIVEKNWFFRLSKYQDKLWDFYQQRPDFVNPDFRFNEVKSWFDKWLEDFSISRQNSTFWIKLPFDENSVAYVWYDALLNYITVCQWWDEDFWPADFHVIWKEITRFHAIYWPAMLMSAGIELPKQEIVTGFLTVDWQKISKSLGNVIDPVELSEKYSRDAITLYLFSDLTIGNDWDFSWDKFKWMYNSILVWGWWNLVSRVVSLAQKNWVVKGKFYEEKAINLLDISEWIDNRWEPINSLARHVLTNLWSEYWFDSPFSAFLEKFKLWIFLNNWNELVNYCNSFMQETQPWVKLKDESTKEDWLKDLEFLLYMIRQIGILSAPFFVEGFEKLKNILGDETIVNINTGKDWWLEEWELKKIFDISDDINKKEFSVNLNPGHLYNRVEE